MALTLFRLCRAQEVPRNSHGSSDGARARLRWGAKRRLGIELTGRRLVLPNAADGVIRLHPSGVLIAPSMTETAFRSTTEGSVSSAIVVNPPHASYRLPGSFELDDREVGLSLWFSFDRLTVARIFVSAVAEPPDAWSGDRELQHRDILENLLHKAYGSVRTFSWGRVRAAYDSRSGGSSISVRYGGSRGR
jgi:hypothetical protein